MGFKEMLAAAMSRSQRSEEVETPPSSPPPSASPPPSVSNLKMPPSTPRAPRNVQPSPLQRTHGIVFPNASPVSLKRTKLNQENVLNQPPSSMVRSTIDQHGSRGRSGTQPSFLVTAASPPPIYMEAESNTSLGDSDVMSNNPTLISNEAAVIPSNENGPNKTTTFNTRRRQLQQHHFAKSSRRHRENSTQNNATSMQANKGLSRHDDVEFSSSSSQETIVARPQSPSRLERDIDNEVKATSHPPQPKHSTIHNVADGEQAKWLLLKQQQVISTLCSPQEKVHVQGDFNARRLSDSTVIEKKNIGWVLTRSFVKKIKIITPEPFVEIVSIHQPQSQTEEQRQEVFKVVLPLAMFKHFYPDNVSDMLQLYSMSPSATNPPNQETICGYSRLFEEHMRLDSRQLVEHLTAILEKNHSPTAKFLPLLSIRMLMSRLSLHGDNLSSYVKRHFMFQPIRTLVANTKQHVLETLYYPPECFHVTTVSASDLEKMQKHQRNIFLRGLCDDKEKFARIVGMCLIEHTLEGKQYLSPEPFCLISAEKEELEDTPNSGDNSIVVFKVILPTSLVVNNHALYPDSARELWQLYTTSSIETCDNERVSSYCILFAEYMDGLSNESLKALWTRSLNTFQSNSGPTKKFLPLLSIQVLAGRIKRLNKEKRSRFVMEHFLTSEKTEKRRLSSSSSAAAPAVTVSSSALASTTTTTIAPVTKKMKTRSEVKQKQNQQQKRQQQPQQEKNDKTSAINTSSSSNDSASAPSTFQQINLNDNDEDLMERESPEPIATKKKSVHFDRNLTQVKTISPRQSSHPSVISDTTTPVTTPQRNQQQVSHSQKKDISSFHYQQIRALIFTLMDIVKQRMEQHEDSEKTCPAEGEQDTPTMTEKILEALSYCESHPESYERLCTYMRFVSDASIDSAPAIEACNEWSLVNLNRISTAKKEIHVLESPGSNVDTSDINEDEKGMLFSCKEILLQTMFLLHTTSLKAAAPEILLLCVWCGDFKSSNLETFSSLLVQMGKTMQLKKKFVRERVAQQHHN